MELMCILFDLFLVSRLSSQSLDHFDCGEPADVSCHSGLPVVCLGGFEECQRDRSAADPGCRDAHRGDSIAFLDFY